MVVTTRGARVGSWTPAELGVLLQAVEPVPGPASPAGAVAVRGRVVEVVPLPGPTGGPPGHSALVAAGRLVAGLEIAIRSLGWDPRRDVAEDARTEPLVTLVAARRRPAIPLVLARHRIDRRLRDGLPHGRGRPELSQVVDVARGASTTRARCVLANGPTHDGAPVWHAPGTRIPEAVAVDLPWALDPVLAVCTHHDAARDQVAAGIAAHLAVVASGLRGLRADVHTDALDDAAERAAWGRRLDPGAGRVQALVHLHP